MRLEPVGRGSSLSSVASSLRLALRGDKALAARRNPHSPGDGLLRRSPLAALACLGIDGSWTLGVGCGLSRFPATAGWAPWRPGLGGV